MLINGHSLWLLIALRTLTLTLTLTGVINILLWHYYIALFHTTMALLGAGGYNGTS